jgi:hypothetical protein
MRAWLVGLIAIAACGGSDDPVSAPPASDAGNTSSSSSSSGASSSGSLPDAGGTTSPWPHSIPLKLTPTSGDDTSSVAKLTLDLTVGSGAIFRAMLDSGSNGIVALPSAVPPNSVTIDNTRRVDYVYGGSLRVTGSVAKAVIRLGDLVAPEPVEFLLVDGISCTAAHPNCPADGADLSKFTFKGGLGAVVGVGMRSVATTHFVQSPLLQLGAPTSRFVIETKKLALEIEPSDATVARFTKLVSLPSGEPSSIDGVPSYDDRQIPFCANAFCDMGLLDTGGVEQLTVSAPPNWGKLGVPPGSNVIPGGTTVDFAIAETSTWKLTVGTPPTAGLDRVLLQSNSNNLGLMPFKHFDVLYDPRGGKIGLAPP